MYQLRKGMPTLPQLIDPIDGDVFRSVESSSSSSVRKVYFDIGHLNHVPNQAITLSKVKEITSRIQGLACQTSLLDVSVILSIYLGKKLSGTSALRVGCEHVDNFDKRARVDVSVSILHELDEAFLALAFYIWAEHGRQYSFEKTVRHMELTNGITTMSNFILPCCRSVRFSSSRPQRSLWPRTRWFMRAATDQAVAHAITDVTTHYGLPWELTRLIIDKVIKVTENIDIDLTATFAPLENRSGFSQLASQPPVNI